MPAWSAAEHIPDHADAAYSIRETTAAWKMENARLENAGRDQNYRGGKPAKGVYGQTNVILSAAVVCLESLVLYYSYWYAYIAATLRCSLGRIRA